MKKLPKVALGTWSWGTGFAGGDTVFGNHLPDSQMAEVFSKAMQQGLCGTRLPFMGWEVPKRRWVS